MITTNLLEDAHKNYKSTLRAIETDLRHNITKESLTKLTSAKIKQEINKTIGGRTIEQRLRLGARNLFKDTTAALRKDILDSIKEHQDKGHSIEKMTKTIKTKLDTDTYKARRIARTESHRMREFSTYEAQVEAQKYEMFKREWLATADMRTRQEHLVLGGQFEGEDGRFHYGEYAASYPGGFGVAKMDIHCRCTIVANFDDVLGNPDFIKHGNNQESWENDIMDRHSRFNKEKLLTETLNPDLYPFDVAMNVSADLEPLMNAGAIGDFDIAMQKSIRKRYMEYLTAEYETMGIELRAGAEDVLYLARQQKLLKALAESYPEGVQKIKVLTYRNEPTADYMGFMQPYRGLLNINTANIDLDVNAAIKSGWSTQGALEFKATDRTLVHEYGHFVDLQENGGWASSRMRKPTTMTGYGRTNSAEAFAESFVNAVTAPAPDKEMVKFIEKATKKKVNRFEVNLEVLT